MGKGKAVLFAGIVVVAAMLPGMVAQVRQQDVGELKSRLSEMKARVNQLESRLAEEGEVRARRFVVVDKDGQCRAVLGMGGDQPVMMVADETGKPCCLMGTYDGKVECCCVTEKEKK